MKRIAEYISGYDLIKFQEDHKTIDAVVRNFEIIGEAAKNIPSSLKNKCPEVPCQEMYYLRNKVSHEYFGVDSDVIWDVAANFLPENKIQIDKIIATEINI